MTGEFSFEVICSFRFPDFPWLPCLRASQTCITNYMTATRLFVDKSPLIKQTADAFFSLSLWSLCFYIYECPYWQLKATKQQWAHLFATYSHKQLCVPQFSCLSHGNLSSHIKTKGIHQRSASWLPHQNKISDNKKQNIMSLPTIHKAFPASLHKASDFVSFWVENHAHKQEIHCYYSIN